MAVRIRNVRKSYGKLSVLDGVSFDVRDSEFVCVIGESGCGKTTLLRIIAGLESYEGVVEYDGKRIGFVFQDDRLLPWRTALENVAFSLEAMGFSRTREVAEDALRRVGLEQFRNFYPKQLSGGMRQRVGIARAIAVNPDLLLMDEPFASLDAQSRERMQEDLLKIVEGKTVIFVTHSIEEAVYLADRIVVLSPRPAKVAEILEMEIVEKDRTSEEFLEAVRVVRTALIRAKEL